MTQTTALDQNAHRKQLINSTLILLAFLVSPFAKCGENEMAYTHLWSAPIPYELPSAPIVHDDYVYIGPGNGELQCLDLVDGTLIWTNKDSLGYEVRRIDAAGDTILFSAADYLYSVSAKTGTTRWRRDLGDWAEFLPQKFGNTCIIGTSSKLFRIEIETGKVVWSRQAKARLRKPLIRGQQLIVANHAGLITTIDANTGDTLGQREVEGDITNITESGPETLLVARAFGLIEKVDFKSWVTQWKFQCHGQFDPGTWAIIDDLLVIGDYHHGANRSSFTGPSFVYGIDLETGRQRWQFAGPQSFVTGPASHAQSVFFPNRDAFVYELDVATGDLISKHHTPTHEHFSPVVHRDFLFLREGTKLSCYRLH